MIGSCTVDNGLVELGAFLLHGICTEETGKGDYLICHLLVAGGARNTPLLIDQNIVIINLWSCTTN